MPSSPWTTPRTWTPGEKVTAAQLNTHVRDNLKALYQAKHGLFGKLAAINVPNNAWTGISWDFAVEQDPIMWSSTAYPDRISPPLAGVWMVNLFIKWESSAATGFRSIRVMRNGTTTLAQDRTPIEATSQYMQVTAVTRMNGAGDYVNAAVSQWSGAADTLVASQDRNITLTWLGA